MRIRMLTVALTAATVSLAGPTASQASQSASDIVIAAIAAGRLYVVGTTERPHTPVSLESRFTTESDDTGKFQYELVYHPARCIVAAEIEGRTYQAVVSYCGQQGPAGEAATASPTVAAKPPEHPGLPDPGVSSAGGIVAAPAGIVATPVASAEPKPDPTAASITAPARKRALTLAQPARRLAMRPAPPRPHKPAVRPKTEQDEPDGGEVPLAE